MDCLKDFKGHIDKINQKLNFWKVIRNIPIENVLIKECNYKSGTQFPNPAEMRPFSREEQWGGKSEMHAWFYAKVQVPDLNEGTHAVLRLTTGNDYGWDAVNPQFMCYIDGVLWQGFDVNHTDTPITPGEHDVYFYGYSGANCSARLFSKLDIDIIDNCVENLRYMLSVPSEVLTVTDNETAEYVKIYNGLRTAVNMLRLSDRESEEFIASVKAASEYLKNGILNCPTDSPIVYCVGHTHIDVAWLWTVQQTREKAQRSFSTVINLMDQFPDYKFMGSQPALYKYCKEECPELFERIKEKVAEGKWDAEGGMFVEADCNLISGESFIRQFLYGKKFFKENFNIDSHILWLPDVFGYSAAMPQILKKCGINTFVTSKISWNDTNRFPFDIFNWKGIDGTEMFTTYITTQRKMGPKAESYNGTCYCMPIDARDVIGAYQRQTQKDIADMAIDTFGYGDGGGGATEWMLKNIETMKNGIPGVPAVKTATATEYIDDLKAKCNGKTLPRWAGELYLEYHRGTYTSQALTKKNNRRAECEMMSTEILMTLADILCDTPYDKASLDALMENFLVSQFHDVIPGSSIRAVYENAEKEYIQMFSVMDKLKNEAMKSIAEKVKGDYIVFNTSPFTQSSYVDIDGKKYFAEEVPSKGYKAISLKENFSVKVNEKEISNEFFTVIFDDFFNIVSLKDNRTDRQYVKDGGRFNRLTIFEDYPTEYPTWEIRRYDFDKPIAVEKVLSSEAVDEGGRKGIRYTKKIYNITVTQTVWLYDEIDRIDIETEIDAQTKEILLKSYFDTDIDSPKATFDIQFGNVERPTHFNTSWDEARFESCAHKWMDISEYSYGVSVLNDCKYGCDIHDGVIGLTLLKTSIEPDPNADIGYHSFTYSIYPHEGDWREAETVEYAYDLNMPLVAVRGANGELDDEYSLIESDYENIVIETIKAAEDGDGYIVRAYECIGATTDATFTMGVEAEEIEETDCLEENGQKIGEGADFTVHFKPYEIKTFRIK